VVTCLIIVEWLAINWAIAWLIIDEEGIIVYNLRAILDPDFMGLVSYVILFWFGNRTFGKRVTKNTPPINKQQGQTLLRRDLSVAKKAVRALVGPRLTPNQFSAYVSLVFNIGSGNFRARQIRQRLLRKDHEGAADIW